MSDLSKNQKETSDDDEEKNKLKSALAKANSDSADYKEKLKSMQEPQTSNPEESEKDSSTAKIAELEAKIAELERKTLVSDNTAKLMEIGYDKESAAEMTNAVLDKDFDKIIAIQTKYLETQKKAIQADLLKATPKPTGGNSVESSQKNQFQKYEQDFFNERHGSVKKNED